MAIRLRPHDRRYNHRPLDPTGVPENQSRCVAAVWDRTFGSQCSRRRGHGPDGLWCKQHTKMIERYEKIMEGTDEDNE